MQMYLMPARAGRLVSVLALVIISLSTQPADAFEFPTPGASLCANFGAAPYFANVIDNVPGDELIVTNVDENVLADNDGDTFSVVKMAITVRVLDRMGNVIWKTDPLNLTSPDLAETFPPFFYIFPGFSSDTFAAPFFLGGFECYETIYAVEAGGQKYIAVVAGFLTQSGDDEVSGKDETRLNVWILNRDSGDIVRLHKIRARNNKYVSGVFLSGIGGIDDDANDELVVAFVDPLNNGKYKLIYETYNILTGALEDKFDVTARNTRIFQ